MSVKTPPPPQTHTHFEDTHCSRPKFALWPDANKCYWLDTHRNDHHAAAHVHTHSWLRFKESSQRPEKNHSLTQPKGAPPPPPLETSQAHHIHSSVQLLPKTSLCQCYDKCHSPFLFRRCDQRIQTMLNQLDIDQAACYMTASKSWPTDQTAHLLDCVRVRANSASVSGHTKSASIITTFEQAVCLSRSW
jgi:hypothetical protein